MSPHTETVLERRTVAQTLRPVLRGRLAAFLLAGAALVGGVFLRLWQIDELGFNSDEAVYTGQAGSLANLPEFEQFFAIFRAHPLLFQTILSLGFRLELGEPFQRVTAAAFGIATIYLTYRLGTVLYHRRAGLIAALFMALMPYHVVASRQVLLDVPMTFFSTLSLYLIARFAQTRRALWLYAAGGALGLAVLSKETAIVLMAAVYAFLVLRPEVRVRAKQLLLAGGVMAAVVAAFPLALLIAGRSETGGNYLAWQFFRRANHDLFFYPLSVPLAIGPLLIVAAGVGLWLLRRRHSWRETVLLAWVAAPLTFFELYPIKGFQYLLVIAPPLAVLAARTVAFWSPELLPDRLRSRLGGAWVAPLALLVIAVTLAVPSWLRIEPSRATSFLAGSGGVPGGREAGTWIDRNVPKGAQVMTIGPSMANVLQFYGKRKAYALSVSTNPLNRNPSYEPIHNPDLRLRSNQFQYVVWDAFSADRSAFFSRALLGYVDRYNGRVVHTETVTRTSEGRDVREPVIVIYEVHP
ncbi:MAG TPA: glycosyltransferase family 39 protein [Thermoleophilaceae bacterium]|jgi:hypothetical protein